MSAPTNYRVLMRAKASSIEDYARALLEVCAVAWRGSAHPEPSHRAWMTALRLATTRAHTAAECGWDVKLAYHEVLATIEAACETAREYEKL